MNEPFEIVFNDEYLVVLNKIGKLLVQPNFSDDKNTLTFLLSEKLKEKIFPCHRLDRETTGLIIYAKSSEIQSKIMDQFRNREVKKKYLALINGRLKAKKGVIEGYIIDKEGKRFGEKPKQAKTICKTLKQFKNFSFVELVPLTGRTNQLRIQLAEIGHPILGERKYAFGRDFEVKFKRLALHASSLIFIHPVSGERVSLESDLPQDMKNLLK